jgi:hypothetical protein
MAHALISFCIPIGVAKEPMLHALRRVGVRGLRQQIDLIGHPTKGKTLSIRTE